MTSEDEPIVNNDEPEVRRARARGFVKWCNAVTHEAPWIEGDRSASGGVYIALELAELAYAAHALPYKAGLWHLSSYDPRRFTWVYDETGDAKSCVKVRDEQTGRIAIWSWF